MNKENCRNPELSQGIIAIQQTTELKVEEDLMKMLSVGIHRKEQTDFIPRHPVAKQTVMQSQLRLSCSLRSIQGQTKTTRTTSEREDSAEKEINSSKNSRKRKSNRKKTRYMTRSHGRHCYKTRSFRRRRGLKRSRRKQGNLRRKPSKRRRIKLSNQSQVSMGQAA